MALPVLTILKSKIYAIGAVLIAALLTVVKFLVWRNSALKEKVETAEANLQLREETDRIDAEIESDFSDLRREAQKDIKAGEIPAHLRKPDRI